MLLVGEERAPVAWNERLFVGAGDDAFGAVLEAHDDVLDDVVNLPDPVPVRDVVPRPERAHVCDAARVDAAHQRAVREAQVQVQVHSRRDALRPERVVGARHDVPMQKRAVHDPEVGVGLDLHALGAAEPAHLAVVLGDGLLSKDDVVQDGEDRDDSFDFVRFIHSRKKNRPIMESQSCHCGSCQLVCFRVYF